MHAVTVLPNILSLFGHPHPLYQGTAPVTQQNLNYMRAVMSQAQSPQSSGPRMMALDMDSMRGKRPRAGNNESFKYKSITEICATSTAWSEPTVHHVQL